MSSPKAALSNNLLIIVLLFRLASRCLLALSSRLGLRILSRLPLVSKTPPNRNSSTTDRVLTHPLDQSCGHDGRSQSSPQRNPVDARRPCPFARRRQSMHDVRAV